MRCRTETAWRVTAAMQASFNHKQAELIILDRQRCRGQGFQSLLELDLINTSCPERGSNFSPTQRQVLSARHFGESEDMRPRFTDPVFLQHAEARVGPWWEARIRTLIKQDCAEEAGALFREFETPEKGF